MSDDIKDFKLEKRGNEWCAVSEDGTKSLGCYPTEDEARERLRQVEAAKAAKGMEEQTKEHAFLPGVEIFRTGEWNGDKYSTEDLDNMVDAFDKVGYRPPVKLGHKEGSGDPAYGWVQSIRREGDRLIADFSDLPAEIFKRIRDRRFDAVSAEIFWNLKRGTDTFKRALKAVALLGAEIPAVAGLKPLRDTVDFTSMEAESHIYQIGLKEFDMADQKQAADEKKAAREDDGKVKTLSADLDKAQEQIKALTAKLEESAKAKDDKKADDSALKITELQEQVKSLEKIAEQSAERERRATIDFKIDKLRLPAFRTHFSALYDLATSADAEKTVKFAVQDGDKIEEKDTDPVAVIDDLVKRLNKHSEKLFAEYATSDLKRDDVPKTENPGEQLDALAKKYALDKKVDYAAAFDAVMSDPENRDLVAAYARN